MPLLPEDGAGASDGSLLVIAREYVLIDGHRDGWAGMADPLAHRFDRDTGTDQGGRVRMPDVMEPDRWEAGSAHCLGEPLREPLRMDRDTVLSNEQKAGLLPNRPDAIRSSS